MSLSPEDFGPAYVVRIRCGGGGLTYWGAERLTKPQAESVAADYVAMASKLAAPKFIPFETGLGRVQIRTERITCVEVARTQASLPSATGVPANGIRLESR